MDPVHLAMEKHVLHILIVLFLAMAAVVVHVGSAPVFRFRRSKKEPACSHELDPTLCWTVQLHQPLHTGAGTEGEHVLVERKNSNLTSADSPILSPLPGTSHSIEVKDVEKMQVYDEMAALLAQDTELTLLGRVGEFIDHFVLCHNAMMEKSDGSRVFKDYHRAHSNLRQQDGQTFAEVKAQMETALENHHDVAWFNIETVHRRQKRAISFNDPAYPQQWHLVNRVEWGMDINITGVWKQGITGAGVTVAVVDDGLAWDNPDIHSNYNVLGSWDLNDNDPDPMPNTAKVSNHHGTRCAGEIAAVANNNVCGVGVAYQAKVSGIRLLDGPMTDSLEAEAFNKKFDINDIYSCSWGPDDDGKTVDGPHLLAAKSMKYGVDFGRHGYGSIFVVASGNGGSKQDNCNYDGYANSIYTVTIGAVDESGAMPYYAEECASMLGVTFSSGIASRRDIVTTDWRYRGGTGCTDQHTGTSAAAPLVAGMIGLMLEARPCLTWRDVQYIIIMTAVKVDVDPGHWQKNGAGLQHSHKHGFGLIKAWRLVNTARVWRPVPWMTSYSREDASGWVITRGYNAKLNIMQTVTHQDIAGYSLFLLEYVQVTMTLTHPVRGKLGIHLQCPSGTTSVIGAPRPHDNSSDGFTDWTFTTVRCWGEEPTGNWTLLISDSVPPDSDLFMGRLIKWRLTLFGTPMTTAEFQERQREVQEAMSGEYLSVNYTPPCEPPPVTSPPVIPLSEKTLKILFLASAFCLVFAIYETFEYMLCYGEEKRQQQEEMSRLGQQSSANSRCFAEDTPETVRLLAQQESSINGGTMQTVDILDPMLTGSTDDDDMFLMDSGTTSGLGVMKNNSRGVDANDYFEESIPLSLFNRSIGNLQGDSASVETDTLLQGCEMEGCSQAQTNAHSSKGTAMSKAPDSTAFTENTTAMKESYSSPSRKSILSDMWKALTQDQDSSDSDSGQDEIFNRSNTSKFAPLQNGASGINKWS